MARFLWMANCWVGTFGCSDVRTLGAQHPHGVRGHPRRLGLRAVGESVEGEGGEGPRQTDFPADSTLLLGV